MCHCRQKYTDLGTAPLGIDGLDRPAVLLDELLDDRQAEPRALGLARHVRIERVVQEPGREARAVVGDLDLDPLAVVVAGQPRGDVDTRVRTVLGGLQRVAHQIM